jgi:hypothetical protein
MSANEYMKDLAIDPHALEEEWMRQPALFQKYTDLLVRAQQERDKAKERLDVVKSKLDLDIRNDHEAFGLKKITEGAITACILTNSIYKDAQKRLNEATYKVGLLNGAIRGLEHKKKSLENLVSLWLGSYFAGPQEPKELAGGKRMVDIVHDRVEEKQKQGLRQGRSRRRK